MLATMESTIGDLVKERPNRARLFESLGLDYCCGGKNPLAAACLEKGLDAPTVLRLVHVFDEQVPLETTDFWTKLSMAELADHIEQTHHAYLKSELPRLEHLVQHVTSRHGQQHSHLREVNRIFVQLKAELETHMAVEESVIFPACRALEVANPSQQTISEFDRTIDVMVHDHDEAGQALSQLRDLTEGFTPPSGACNTFRVMYAALADLTQDMHRHVHKENSALFPKAREVREKLKSRPA